MSILGWLIIGIIGVFVLTFGIIWLKKLPQSVTHFLTLLGIMGLFCFGLWYLKKKLTQVYQY